MEPIFEADLQPEQYAYRANRSAYDAIREVHGWLNKGLNEVVDADLSGYFETIPVTGRCWPGSRNGYRCRWNKATGAAANDGAIRPGGTRKARLRERRSRRCWQIST